MLLALLTVFVGSGAAPWIHKRTPHQASRVFALIPLALFLYFLSWVPVLAEQGPLVFSHAWVSGLEINLSFYLDGLSLLFACVITFVGCLVLIYSGPYFGDAPHTGRFYGFFLFFMGSMLGLVLSDNIITLFMFWELTSVSSYLLIGFHHELEPARKAAWQALMITGLGGLSLLIGGLLLGMLCGSYELSELLSQGEVLRKHAYYPVVFFLIALAAFTKSAQFPFHFWLPDAMEAPAPVSTYLHSATMVKAGIYLLARMSPILGNTVLWQSVLVFIGAVTMLLGAIMALKQTDLKKILAYSTVSVLGTLVFLLGTGTHAAVEAAMAYIMIHALYKAALFLMAGIVDHETGTRNVESLSGLGRMMPITACAAVLAGLSMAGLPPLFGFIGKELLYGATLGAPVAAWLLTGVALSTNALLVVSSVMVGMAPFVGTQRTFLKPVHDPARDMWFGPLILAGLGIAIGLFPGMAGVLWVAPAVAAVMQMPVEVNLALMHGFTMQLLLSIITFFCGVALFLWRKKLLSLIPQRLSRWPFTPSSIYRSLIKGIHAFAGLSTRLLQNGHLHLYILIIVLTTVVMIGFSLRGIQTTLPPFNLRDIRFHEGILALIIMAATFLAVGARSRLMAIISLGVLGYSVVLFYIIFGAPDVAMTQFAVDTLTLILLVIVIKKLPRYGRFSTPMERLRDGIPALATGGLVTGLIILTLGVSKGSRLSAYFNENSFLLAKGRNIVNVILVDFRGLDTMGEVTVLVVAAIGVFSLLKLKTNHNKLEKET
ncbi:MAG: putative monovalent cation/H+ antiporter subunit A [Desulfobacteraceae bacterium]|nr:putative monovalent cation/H+ antiporter subunit A [Desulfobacteraceae bacterium]